MGNKMKKTKKLADFDTSAEKKDEAWHQKQSTQWVFRISIGLVIIGTAIWWFFFHPYVATNDARVAATMVRISPSGAGGKVIALKVSEGSWVKKGDIVAELDHKTAEAQLLRAKARYNLAGSELHRTQLLYKQGNVPSREMEKALANASVSEADLKVAEIALENTYLKSPIDGIVVQKPAEVGNIIEPGQTAVSVVDIANAWVAANIEETSIALVKPGQTVYITVDEGGKLIGDVSEVRHAAASAFSLIPSDNASGNYIKLVQRIPIKITLKPHPKKILRVGQSVEIKIRVH